jgi:hypothetical protein
MHLSARPGALLRSGASLLTLLVGLALAPQNGRTQVLQNGWYGYGSNPQHTCLSKVAAQPMKNVHWSTLIDLTLPDNNTNASELLIHYATPLITPRNTVILTIRTDANSDFRVEGHRATDGGVIWTQTTDYIMPPHNWLLPCGSTLTPNQRLYTPGAGGTVYFRDGVDTATPGQTGQICFYTSLASYTASKSDYNSKVFICTPLTSDANGNIYFGFQVTGAPTGLPGLTSGIARISASGVATYVPVTSFVNDGNAYKPVMNCAPALSLDGKTVYCAINVGNFSGGYMLALDSRLTNLGAVLPVIGMQLLFDPSSGNEALLPDDGSATPTVGPDGDVYFGVLENPFPAHHDRGWLMHFNANLHQIKTPGSFGWDDTASIVPAAMVPSYHGTSSYLLMCKYNDYGSSGLGGTGINKIAVIDPQATQADFVLPGVSVMKEILTIAGPTPDPTTRDSAHPNAVREWCINSAAVDPFTKCIIANCEDGWVYRWDMTTNTLTDKLQITAGVGEAYTPTVIGPDGTVYAINNGRFWAIGK